MYQVVASDLDGTLLSPDHTLSPYAKETLKLLTARGINFVFATGRHHVDVGQIRDNLEIKSYNDYLQWRARSRPRWQPDFCS